MAEVAVDPDAPARGIGGRTGHRGAGRRVAGAPGSGRTATCPRPGGGRSARPHAASANCCSCAGRSAGRNYPSSSCPDDVIAARPTRGPRTTPSCCAVNTARLRLASRAGWRGPSADIAERTRRGLVRPGGPVHRVRRADRHRLLGFHWTKVHPTTPSHSARSTWSAIDPDAQGRGLGRLLTARRACTICVSAGSATVLLYIEARQHRRAAHLRRGSDSSAPRRRRVRRAEPVTATPRSRAVTRAVTSARLFTFRSPLLGRLVHQLPFTFLRGRRRRCLGAALERPAPQSAARLEDAKSSIPEELGEAQAQRLP